MDISYFNWNLIANTVYSHGEQLAFSCLDGYTPYITDGQEDISTSGVVMECNYGVLEFSGLTSEYTIVCKKDGLSAGIIILIIVICLLVVLILICIPLCIMYYKEDREKDEYEMYSRAEEEMRPMSAYSCSNHVVVRGKGEENLIGNSNPFKLSDFNTYIRDMAANRNEKFIKEFRSIRVGSDSKKIISQLSENYHKNRYGTITTYDHSRVRLQKLGGDPNADYINASYINGYVVPNTYIATQGPMDCTIEDFWRMTWEQDVSYVVMLTNIVQGDQPKCAMYWPEIGKSSSYGVVKVKTLSENNFPGFMVRELELEVEGRKRAVLQFHYIDWPDVGYPKENQFLQFLYYIRHLRQGDTKPMVVHCSAGSGWTGVFLAMDFTLDRITKEGTVDVLGCVNGMRQQRSAMVQNEPQYIYLHKLLVDCVNSDNFNNLRANRFRSSKLQCY